MLLQTHIEARTKRNEDVAQLVDAIGLNPISCGFDSHHPYQNYKPRVARDGTESDPLIHVNVERIGT